MKSEFLTLVSLALSLVVLLMSCTEESCDQATEVLMNAGFYSAETEEKINIDSLDIYGLNVPDSVICSNSNLNRIGLPLNPSASGCAFVIINGGRADTLEIFYQSNLKLLSRACGYIYLHEIENINFTENDISGILILNKSVNPGDEENVQIFF
ncbi:MAG: DUF6452 family protein [Bacteroidales bacterium]|nr:DUF6452 family protein [Bacteroidales bacterium]